MHEASTWLPKQNRNKDDTDRHANTEGKNLGDLNPKQNTISDQGTLRVREMILPGKECLPAPRVGYLIPNGHS